MIKVVAGIAGYNQIATHDNMGQTQHQLGSTNAT
jgi:hypothetical protein